VALFQIADNALCSKERLDPEFVKAIWLSGTLARTNELHRLSNRNPYPINCGGFPEYSIFQHLEMHSFFEIESECDCGTFYHRDFQLVIDDLDEIDLLGNPQNVRNAKLPICKRCNDYRVLKTLKPCPTNWLLSFKVKPKNYLFSPLLSDIPRFVQMGQIKYKLQYINYTMFGATSNHAVSVQLIRHTWYRFDGVISPKFRRLRKPRFEEPDSTLDRIVYFKID